MVIPNSLRFGRSFHHFQIGQYIPWAFETGKTKHDESKTLPINVESWNFRFVYNDKQIHHHTYLTTWKDPSFLVEGHLQANLLLFLGTINQKKWNYKKASCKRKQFQFFSWSTWNKKKYIISKIIRLYIIQHWLIGLLDRDQKAQLQIDHIDESLEVAGLYNNVKY